MELRNKYADDSIVFIDDVGFQAPMRVNYGQSLVGQRAVQVVPALRSRNFCFTFRGMLHYELHNRAINPEKIPGMHHVPFHRNRNVKKRPVLRITAIHSCFNRHILHFLIE